MKGIILAGGNGTRLWPITASMSKQLLPIYDKPLIYYPLSTLMLAGIREILVITKPEDLAHFKNLLGDGNQFGVQISFAPQEAPKGIADAFIIGSDFIGTDSVCLILGDNIFFGPGLGEDLEKIEIKEEATIFSYEVADPERYGVVEINAEGRVISIEEKPDQPKSNSVIPGIYFYPNSVVEIARNLKPSARGEIEITDINLNYLRSEKLVCRKLGRGTVWFDTGTFDSLSDASNFIRAIEVRQGIKVNVPEEVALRKGFRNSQEISILLESYPQNEYRKYLESILD
jgi:glucose-1-phosphate thymidylyltransferase